MVVHFTKPSSVLVGRYSAALLPLLGLAVAGCSSLPIDDSNPSLAKEAVTQHDVAVTTATQKLEAEKAVAAASKLPEPDVQLVKVPLVGAPQGQKMAEGMVEDSPEPTVVIAPPVQMPPAESLANSQAQSAAVVAKDPRTFFVTVGHKNTSHINYGAGHEMGFIVNGAQGRDIVLVRGLEYTFDVKTDPRHDFYLSTNAVGAGGAAFTEGVTGQFTYMGEVEFKPNAKTPDLLFYQCRNHPNMGGRIVVVNSVSDVKAAEERLAKDRSASNTKPILAKTEGVSEQKVQQKIAYAEMLLKIKAAGLADDRKKIVIDRIAQAKQSKDKGDFARAYALGGEAADILSGKQPVVVGPSAEELAEQEKSYEERLAGLQALQKSHAEAMKRAQKSGKKGAAVDYDHKDVEKIVAEAQGLATNKRYDDATRVLGKGELAVAKSLNDMLSSQTLVYELTFETPKDEYEYELARFKSYDELIPVAVDVKKPSEQAMALMKGYVTKSYFYRDKAAESAVAGRYDEAVAIMKDATTEVRRGLMTLGVSM